MPLGFVYLFLFILERWNKFSRTTHRFHKIKVKFKVWPCILLTFFSDLYLSPTGIIILFTNAECIEDELYLAKCDNMVMMFMFPPSSRTEAP